MRRMSSRILVMSWVYWFGKTLWVRVHLIGILIKILWQMWKKKSHGWSTRKKSFSQGIS